MGRSNRKQRLIKEQTRLMDVTENQEFGLRARLMQKRTTDISVMFCGLLFEYNKSTEQENNF